MIELAKCAQKYLGTPYVLHGRDERGMDCFGLVVKSAEDVGIKVPDFIKVISDSFFRNILVGKGQETSDKRFKEYWEIIDEKEATVGDLVLTEILHNGRIILHASILAEDTTRVWTTDKRTGVVCVPLKIVLDSAEKVKWRRLKDDSSSRS